MQELSPPPETLTDENAVEILRAFAARKKLHCSIRADAWEEVGWWGILLADVTRHVANALAEERGLDQHDSIKRIRELFDAELDNPTDTPTGRFIN